MRAHIRSVAYFYATEFNRDSAGTVDFGRADPENGLSMRFLSHGDDGDGFF